MQVFSIKDRILPGRKHRQIKSEVIQPVQSPVLIHHHLSLEIELPKQKAIQQITAIVAEHVSTGQLTKNLVVAIDITCHPELIAAGIAPQLAQSILLTLDEHYPWLKDRFVGLSDDEACLTLHGLMRTGKLAWEEIDNQHRFVFE